MTEYTIHISYSWGEEKEPYGNYPNKEEAFKAMCIVAAREAYTQNEESKVGRTCTLLFDAAKGTIDLHYDYDNTCGHYKVVKVGCENGARVKERLKESDDDRCM